MRAGIDWPSVARADDEGWGNLQQEKTRSGADTTLASGWHEQPTFAQGAPCGRWLRWATFASGVRDVACQPEPRAQRVIGEGWRRGWDSDPISSLGICNLQRPRCRDCHGCQHCRRALPAIARWHVHRQDRPRASMRG